MGVQMLREITELTRDDIAVNRDVVYLLTCGDGSDGNEWLLISIHKRATKAAEAWDEYLKDYPYADLHIEEWRLND